MHDFRFEAAWEKVFGIPRRKMSEINARMVLKTLGLEDGSF